MVNPGNTDSGADDFRVGLMRHTVEGFFERSRGVSHALSRLESRMHREEMTGVAVNAPIYVTGLARAGTTLLLELLDASPETVSHRYRDYPGLRTPLFWKRFVDLTAARHTDPVERAHQDGVLVTPDSPEAFEEVLWMDFFPDAHDPSRTNVLAAGERYAAFETFYREHIRKLLFAYGGTRYLAKGNYNIARLDYILSLFPDARFVLPVRDPVSHIGSLMRQHARFTAGQTRHPRAREHLRRIGHFEFGLDRRPINLGGDAESAAIMAMWERGEDVRGWARYWRVVHEHIARRLAANPALRDAAIVVDYAELCRRPVEIVTGVVDHVGLDDRQAILGQADTVKARAYYDTGFTEDDLAIIEEETATTARSFGLSQTGGERAVSAA